MERETEPLVSVGLPCYNRPETLKRAIDCMLNQTYRNIELIISNDCSPNPEVYRLLDEYAAKDTRVKVWHQPVDLEVYGNYYFVQSQARGRYFMYLQDDDWWERDSIELMVKDLEAHPDTALSIGRVLESVVTQTRLPSLFLIVDGGSTDYTIPAIQAYAKCYPWIHMIQQTNHDGAPGHEKISCAMVEAYQTMTHHLDGSSVYIGHMDADMLLNPTTFEVLVGHIEQDDHIGAVGADLYTDGTPEVYPDDEIPNIRLYRRAAIESIGGYPYSQYSWDSVILAKLRLKGWKVKQCPAAKVVNLRGGELSVQNKWKTAVDFGKARHYLGYSLPLFLAGVAYATKNNGVVFGAGLMRGYFGDLFTPQTCDAMVRNYFRNTRLKELMRARTG